MNRIISETVANLENLKMRVVLGRVESDLEIEDTLQDAIDSIRNAPIATTLDLTMVRRFNFSDVIPGVIYPDPNGPACWFADLATLHDAGFRRVPSVDPVVVESFVYDFARENGDESDDGMWIEERQFHDFARLLTSLLNRQEGRS